MDRIRVGLTGLAAVFLVTLGAALAFRPPVDTVAVAESKAGEPLAQLGVAPGADKESVNREAANKELSDQDSAVAVPEGPEGQADAKASGGAVIVPEPFSAPAALPMQRGVAPSFKSTEGFERI